MRGRKRARARDLVYSWITDQITGLMHASPSHVILAAGCRGDGLTVRSTSNFSRDTIERLQPREMDKG